MSSIAVRRADPSAPEIRLIVEAHMAHSRANTPETSCYVMTVDEMLGEEVAFWALFAADRPIGCGALRRHSEDVVEAKSVHILEAERGQGHARAIMNTLIEEAKASGYRTMGLETGAAHLAGYAAARALYERLGFTYGDPLPGYGSDPNSAFMWLDLNG